MQVVLGMLSALSVQVVVGVLSALSVLDIAWEVSAALDMGLNLTGFHEHQGNTICQFCYHTCEALLVYLQSC